MVRRDLGVLLAVFIGLVGLLPMHAQASQGVDRVAGINRYETAALIHQRFYQAGPTPFLYAASGANWPDALTASAAAAVAETGPMKSEPMFIVHKNYRSEWTHQMQFDFTPSKTFAVGGEGVIDQETFIEIYNSTPSGDVIRLAGADRFGTAAAVTHNAFPVAVDTLFITTGSNFPDALGAGAAAAQVKAPLLIVSPNAIPAPIVSELQRLHPRQIYLIGGTGAVSATVEAQLRTYTTSHSAASVERVWGSDRYATAVAVSKRFFPTAPMVFLATGRNFPDALVAGELGVPILLAPGDSVPAAVIQEIKRLGTGVTILGGYGAISQAAEDQLRAALS